MMSSLVIFGKHRTWIGRFYRSLIVLFLLLVSLIYIDWGQVLSQVETNHLVAFLLSQPLQILAIFLLSFRFLLLSNSEVRNLKHILHGYILSVGMNTFIVGRLSEVLKISYPMRAAGLKAASLTAAIIVEKFMDLFFLALFVALGFGSTWISINQEFLFLVLVVSVLALPLFVKILHKGIRRFDARNVKSKTLAWAIGVSESIWLITNNVKFIYSAIITSIAWLASFGLVVTILYTLFPERMTMSIFLLVFSAMTLGRVIPGLPGSIGTFEAAIVLALTSQGYTFSESIAAAILIHVSQAGFVTVLALAIFASEGAGLRSLLSEIKTDE